MMDKHQFFSQQANRFEPIKHVQRLFEAFEEESTVKDVIIKWKRVFRHLLTLESYPPAPPTLEKETYSLIIEYNTGLFEYVYNLNIAQMVMDAKWIIAVSKPTKKLLSTVDHDNVRTNERNLHDNPIIIVHSPIFDRAICINGNHRIEEAYKRGEKQMTCYELFGDQHVPLMDNRISKAMYLMTMDVYQLSMLKGNQSDLYIHHVEDWL